MKIRIIENRFAAMGIRILPGAGRVERFAAKELAWYLYKMSRSGICIRESGESKPNEIFLCAEGNSEEDSFDITAEAGSIRLAGSNGRSVLFAVYELLERLGCVFAHPFDEFVPETPDIELNPFSLHWKPHFRERGLFQAFFLLRKDLNFDGFIPQRRLPQISYLAKNKYNTFIFSCDYNRLDLWDLFKYQVLDALLDRGLKIVFVSATLDYFCPESENMDFGGYGSSSYVSEKPEWYEENVLRIDHVQVQEFAAKRYAEYLLSHSEFSSVTFAPREEKVSAVFLPEGENLMDLWMKFFNAVARHLAKLAPGRTLDVMVQRSLLPLGESSIPAEKNIRFLFRTDGKMNFHYSLLAEENGSVKNALRLLAAKGNEILFISGSGETPELTPYWKIAQEEYRFCRENKVSGIFEFGGHTYNMLGLHFSRCMDYFCCGKLMENVENDPEAALGHWAEGLYGDSGKAVASFFREMEKEHGKRVRERAFSGQEKWLTLDAFRKVQKNLAEAKKFLSEQDNTRSAGEKIDSLEVFAARSVTYEGRPGFEKEDEFLK